MNLDPLSKNKSPVAYGSNGGFVASLEFSPLGDQLLTGSGNGTPRWWDSASRSYLGTLYPSSYGTAYGAWSGDGSRLLIGRGAGLQLHSFPGTNILRSFTNISETITGVALSPVRKMVFDP